MNRLIAAMLLALPALLGHGQMQPAGPLPDPVEGLDAAQTARFVQFTNELRCLVCQNQTIAESQAPLAQDLRQKVSEQLKAGKTDAQIIDWLTERYGDYVLYRPPLNASTFLLWFGPFLLVLMGLWLARRYTRLSQADAATPAPVDDAALQKLLAEHHRPDAPHSSQKP